MRAEFPSLLIEEEQYLLRNYSREVLKDMSYEELTSLLPYPERRFDHIITDFVTELRSISLKKIDEDINKTYVIYGTIHLVDGKDATFNLYDRQHDNPETISNGGFLTIAFPMDRAITATGLVELHIDLKDANQNGAEIIKSIFDWDCTIKDRYDVHHTELFQTQGVCVAVEFDSYSHAVVCNVDVKVVKDFSGVNVYGEIVARCSGKFSTVLFDRKQNDSIKFNSGNNVQLSRSVVIAPVLSPCLDIHVTFFNAHNNEMVVDETIPFGIWGSRGFQIHEGSSGIIEAQVQWNHPSAQPHFFPGVAPTLSEVVNNYSMYSFGPKLLEIFSVSIVGNMAQDMDIWGSIKLTSYPGQDKILFKEDKSSPQKLLPNRIVPLQSYTDLIVCSAFTIYIELRDASDRSISWGQIIWDERAFANYIALLGWQLCSVVRSVSGYYAAVHYSAFEAGVQAMVKIYLNEKNLDMKYFKVDGTVCAQYSDYDYSTSYQKEYYRKKLFVRKSSEPLLPYPFFNVLVSESSVMVPEGCSLILDVGLDVTTSSTLPTLGVGDNIPRDFFDEVVEFKIDDIRVDSSKHVNKIIDGSLVQLLIHVEWREVR